MSRYQRQMTLPEIGKDGQKKLHDISVLCIGAGGLGCPALLYLAAAGVGTIGIVDFDRVDESNLQRQILYKTSQTGALKSLAAKTQIQELNPEVEVHCHPNPLDLDNIEILFNSYDIVIDGTDNFAAKFLINDAGVKYNTPVIYGAIQQFEGQVSVFDAEHGPCYRCLFPHPPETHIQSCAEAGVIGAIAGVVGTTQAMQAMMIAINDNSFRPLTGQLWTIDMRSMESQLLSIPKNPDCPVCSQKSEDIVLEYTAPLCAAQQETHEISVSELRALHDTTIIDIREEYEWKTGHIPDAVLHPLSKISDGILPDVSEDEDVILYCQQGVRSLQAALFLQERMPNKLLSLKGGYDAYLN